MSWCEACNKGVDYCDCIPQKYRERIAQEIEASHENCWSFRDCTCYEAVAIARGNK